MLEWGPILQKGVETLTASLTKSALERASRGFQRSKPYTVLDFKPHLEFAYQRCTKIKTILSRDVPLPLLEQYVNLKYRIGGKIVDDFELIEQVWAQKRTLVISTGGGGKSMFMRYLWVSCSVNPKGKIPIYVELRRLNDIEGDDIELFLFHTAVSSSNQQARELFASGLREGQFILILDGFDEVQLRKRDRIETKLLDLANKNPETIVVVSGRPEDRYSAWQAFFKYDVLPLDRSQTIALIERVNFKEGTRSKFLTKLKKGEFDQHNSFLCQPLLVTMMLLMFEYFADIPSKVHLFYGQAFDALFYIHDSLKESFRRERHTSYPIDVFKRYFGYFCLISYNAQQLSL
jgi:predicted NACHT family NTPase